MTISAFDLIAGVAWVLMSVAFVATRADVRRFNVICAVILGLVLAACFSGAAPDRSADAVAVVAGLVLYCSGLLILRAIWSCTNCVAPPHHCSGASRIRLGSTHTDQRLVALAGRHHPGWLGRSRQVQRFRGKPLAWTSSR